MTDVLRARRVVLIEEIGSTAEGTEREAASDVLAERGDVGLGAEQRCQARRTVTRGHHLVSNAHRADPSCGRERADEEVGRCRHATSGAEHRLDEHSSER